MKRIGAMACAFFLAFALVGAPAPVRADVVFPVLPEFESRPTRAQLTENGFRFWTNEAGNDGYFAGVPNQENGAIVYGVAAGGGFFAVSDVNFTFLYAQWLGTQTTSVPQMSAVLDSSSGLYYASPNTSFSYSDGFIVPWYATFAEAMQAVKDYIDNPPVDPDPFYPGTVSLSLPAGNVGYVKVSDADSLLTFTTTFNEYSSLFGASWPNITQTYNQGVQLPSTGTTFPLSGSTPLGWYKVEPFNLMGQSKVARCSILAGSGYVAIYNPVYRGVAQGANVQASEFYNNEITISATGVLDYQVFPIGESIGQSGLVGASDSNFEDNWTATIDPNTGVVSYQNQDGESSEPTYGGTTSLPGSQTTASLLERITDLLNSLVERVNNMFSAGHVAISGLISAMENFAGTIMGLYAWLPADVLSVLNSSIILCLIIGVLKVFL